MLFIIGYPTRHAIDTIVQVPTRWALDTRESCAVIHVQGTCVLSLTTAQLCTAAPAADR